MRGVVKDLARIVVVRPRISHDFVLSGKQWTFSYSIRNASTGCRPAARLAGHSPNTRPIAECLGFSDEWRGWRSLPRLALQTALLGLGQDMAWADRIMAPVRHYYRAESQRLAVRPKIMSFHHNSITVHPVFMVIQGHVAQNRININGSSRRYAT